MNNSRNYTNSNKRIQNNNYNNYYSNTSEAFKYAPNYEPEYSPSIKKRTRKKIKEKYVKVEQKEKYLSYRFFVTLSIIATIGICAVNISAKTIEKRIEIEELNAQLKEIKEFNQNLETEIAKNLDLEYVEEYATVNLKMQKPASHQIVHISVPKESHTIKNENLDIDDEGFFKKFNLFKIFKNKG